MIDESGPDAKLLAVPVDRLCKLYQSVKTPEDMPPMLLDQIAHFFQHYKDLEEGKWVKVQGWADTEAARQEVLESIERYQQAPEKTLFLAPVQHHENLCYFR